MLYNTEPLHYPHGYWEHNQMHFQIDQSQHDLG